ncbi:MAG: SDR family oxidoreductase [Marinibacterium sp.]|nr:SDR family oxidoreductase [Marinibacterium sp.]
MTIKDKIVVVTGAGGGIGAALAQRFAAEGAKKVVCSDISLEAAERVAAEIDGLALRTDVGSEDEIAALIRHVEDEIGPIDLFCSNAGILIHGGIDVGNDKWSKIWDVNLMSHVWAARHLVPRMTARGGGTFLITASAAGLLNQIGSAPYGVTKHAAVGFAEWLAMSHGDDGIKVSALCPQAVRTDMTRGFEEHAASIDGMLSPEDVADACVEALDKGEFLILPHKTVRDYMQLKAADYDRWLGGMRKLNRMFADMGTPEG